MNRSLIYKWLIAVTVMTCLALAAEAQGAGTSAVCRVEMIGTKASLSCSRGRITASAADPSIRIQLQASAKAAVTWTDDSNCGVEDRACQLTICGVQGDVPLELKLRLASAPTDERNWGIVCIAGNTTAVIENARVTGNKAAGLVVDGSANVTINLSDFIENRRDRWGGSALIALGSSTLTVYGTTFRDNKHGEDAQYGGIVVLKGSAQATFDMCSFHRNKADYSQAGAISAEDDAVVVITKSDFIQNTAIYGGALAAYGQASVTIDNCTLEGNFASWGGAISAMQNSSVTVVNSSMVGNYVQDYEVQTGDRSPDGGAAYVWQDAVLILNSTLIKNNQATSGKGGGVMMGSNSSVLMIGPGTRVTGNSARRGGGIYIMRELENMADVAPRIVGNTAAISNDVGSELTYLDILNEEEASRFRPRLSENKALLPVKLKLTGPDGLPGAAAVQAMLGDELVGRGESSAVNGEVVLDVDLRQPPGSYALEFSVVSLSPPVNTSMTVRVEKCTLGEVSVPGQEACNVCPRGSYSLDPSKIECTICPAEAVCDSGTIVPKPGYWSSSLQSDQPHRCLYRPACSQNHSDGALLQYQTSPFNNTTVAAFLKAQCAQGHEGKLCGKCAKGYGQQMNALIGRCQQCASTGRILIIYFLAALASMAFIRIMCFFNSIQHRGGLSSLVSESASASQALPAKLPAAGPSPALSDAKLPEAARAADSDAAMARGMPGQKDQLQKDNAQRTVQESQMEAAAGGGPNTRVRAPVGDLMKPFTIYLQWMLVVASVNVQWPAALAGPFLAVAWLFASSSTSSGLDCLLAQRQGRLPLPVAKTLLGLFIPIALLLVLLCMDAISVRIRHAIHEHKQRQQQVLHVHERVLPKGVFARTSIVLTFFFLPSLLRTAYGLFACVRLDSGNAAALMANKSAYYKFDALGRFWLLDVDQQCFVGYHRGWSFGLGIPLLLLLCLGVPFGIIGYLYVNRKHLKESYYLKHYGFLYVTYRPNRYYWEGVMAMQTCVVVAISVFGATLGPAWQCILLTAACGVAQTLLGVFKPFAYREANLVSMQAFGCLVLSAQAALVFELLVLTSEEKSTVDATGTFVAVVTLLINIAFVLSVLWRMVTAIDWAVIGGTAGSLGRAAASKLGGCAGGGCLGGKGACMQP